MKSKLRRICIVGFVFVAVALVAVPSASAWWWTNNPPGFSHRLVPIQDRDGEARGVIVDINAQKLAYQFFTGGPQGNPELIQNQGGQVCVWSIYYELDAMVSTPPQGFEHNIIEIHSYLDFLAPWGWNQVAGDWMLAQATPGLPDHQVGCLHLYYNQHNYQPNEEYRVRLNFSASWYDDSTPPVRTNIWTDLIETYYKII